MAIVVIGNVFVDIKGYPHGKYIPAGRNAGAVQTYHGGVGRNVAEDIANVGFRPAFVSLVDDNAQGDEVIRRLNDHKVNTDYVLRVNDGMGLWLAIFDETGDIVASISKRPDSTAIVKLLEEKGDEIFADCDSIVLEIDLDTEIVRTVFRYAKKYGKKVFAVVANMSIAAERRAFLPLVDCFVCNAEEAGLLFAGNYNGMSPQELSLEMRDKVMSGGIPALVVTMGAEGSVYADINGNYGICPAEKVTVRDTTGAGDAFCAGAAIGLTYGKTLPEAIRIATYLAASVITTAENTCHEFLPAELGIDVTVS